MTESLKSIMKRAAEDVPLAKTPEELLWQVVLDRPLVEVLPECGNLFLETLVQMPPGEWKKEFVQNFTKQLAESLEKDKEKGVDKIE